MLTIHLSIILLLFKKSKNRHKPDSYQVLPLENFKNLGQSIFSILVQFVFMAHLQWIFLIALTSFSQWIWASKLPIPTFVNNPIEQTTSGYVKLSWKVPTVLSSTSTWVFELQKSNDPNFNSPIQLYQGTDGATFLSGLPDGNYYYRVRTSIAGVAHSDWSSTISVQVKHHSLSLALWLFGLGATVFLVTVGIVVQGAVATSKNQ